MRHHLQQCWQTYHSNNIYINVCFFLIPAIEILHKPSFLTLILRGRGWKSEASGPRVEFRGASGGVGRGAAAAAVAAGGPGRMAGKAPRERAAGVGFLTRGDVERFSFVSCLVFVVLVACLLAWLFLILSDFGFRGLFFCLKLWSHQCSPGGKAAGGAVVGPSPTTLHSLGFSWMHPVKRVNWCRAGVGLPESLVA